MDAAETARELAEDLHEATAHADTLAAEIRVGETNVTDTTTLRSLLATYPRRLTIGGQLMVSAPLHAAATEIRFAAPECSLIAADVPWPVGSALLFLRDGATLQGPGTLATHPAWNARALPTDNRPCAIRPQGAHVTVDAVNFGAFGTHIDCTSKPFSLRITNNGFSLVPGYNIWLAGTTLEVSYNRCAGSTHEAAIRASSFHDLRLICNTIESPKQSALTVQHGNLAVITDNTLSAGPGQTALALGPLDLLGNGKPNEYTGDVYCGYNRMVGQVTLNRGIYGMTFARNRVSGNRSSQCIWLRACATADVRTYDRVLFINNDFRNDAARQDAVILRAQDAAAQYIEWRRNLAVLENTDPAAGHYIAAAECVLSAPNTATAAMLGRRLNNLWLIPAIGRHFATIVQGTKSQPPAVDVDEWRESMPETAQVLHGADAPTP